MISEGPCSSAFIIYLLASQHFLFIWDLGYCFANCILILLTYKYFSYDPKGSVVCNLMNI